MGEVSSKEYIDCLQNPSLISKESDNGSRKNNIILMNPELHIHSNDDRIKTFQEENKIKQDQIEVERKMREFQECQREAEKSINENMIREKDNQLKDQNEILKWHIEILTEKQILLKEALEKEETIRKQSLLIKRQNDFISSKFDAVQQTYKRQKRKIKKNQGDFNKWEHNRSCNANEIMRTHNHRKRSKFEDNRINDPMEFWEWNGTQWINTKATHCGKMRKMKNKITDVQSRTDDGLTSTACGGTNNDAVLTSSNRNLDRSYISIQDVTNVDTSTSICRDITYNPVLTIETSKEKIANEIIIPITDDRDRINFSVSFDEHKLRNYKHDQDLLPKAKRLRSSK